MIDWFQTMTVLNLYFCSFPSQQSNQSIRKTHKSYMLKVYCLQFISFFNETQKLIYYPQHMLTTLPTDLMILLIIVTEYN